ncbi:hypothetical protein VTK73DRAFT_9691 [Phialemonium thermophilum]|uniref:Superoxide dismutase copper/zinc binding domain-containing protein n=1 Tax=Phialemonium thermophilum TaxID=223376 RepID=A0ABR3W152_9PEZI
MPSPTTILAALLSVGLLATAQQSTDAVAVTDNLAAEYAAKIDAGSIQGWANATSAAGQAVRFTVDVSGLPTKNAPFTYHIHEFPVPPDGNCTGTGAHLDPFGRTQSPPCNVTAPQTCQVGDLSGKHGAINATSAHYNFTDSYVSTNPSNVAFFGNLSFVIHDSTTARLACANFTQVVSSPSGGDDSSEDGDEDTCDD